jgi:hypothetical protein
MGSGIYGTTLKTPTHLPLNKTPPKKTPPHTHKSLNLNEYELHVTPHSDHLFTKTKTPKKQKLPCCQIGDLERYDIILKYCIIKYR